MLTYHIIELSKEGFISHDHTTDPNEARAMLAKIEMVYPDKVFSIMQMPYIEVEIK